MTIESIAQYLHDACPEVNIYQAHQVAEVTPKDGGVAIVLALVGMGGTRYGSDAHPDVHDGTRWRMWGTIRMDVLSGENVNIAAFRDVCAYVMMVLANRGCKLEGTYLTPFRYRAEFPIQEVFELCDTGCDTLADLWRKLYSSLVSVQDDGDYTFGGGDPAPAD